jgi:hypothetical protein
MQVVSTSGMQLGTAQARETSSQDNSTEFAAWTSLSESSTIRFPLEVFRSHLIYNLSSATKLVPSIMFGPHSASIILKSTVCIRLTRNEVSL